MNNHLRHLILFDDGTAIYTSVHDHIHLSLLQDFQQNCGAIESKCVRNNFEEFLILNRRNRNHLHVNTHVRVKKFDHNYHNARITAVDCSIVKLMFYERQAQTEIWMHQRSPLIEDTYLLPMDLVTPAIASRDTKQNDRVASAFRWHCLERFELSLCCFRPLFSHSLVIILQSLRITRLFTSMRIPCRTALSVGPYPTEPLHVTFPVSV